MEEKPLSIRHRTIANEAVSAIALGCYSMSSAYGPRSDSESATVIRRAVDCGINIFDTADYYGWGHNERLLGTALRGVRNSVFVSTKFGYVPSTTAGYALCSSPTYVRQACEASLRRLGTDYVDLLFQHRVDPKTPIEDTIGAMSDLVKEGKVRYLGLCEVSEVTVRRAHAVHPITAVQMEYSLWTRDVEAQMQTVLASLEITLMAFSPLARGMLTGKLRSLRQFAADDTRRKFPRFFPDNFEKNVALVDQFVEIARECGCTAAQLAIAWLFHRSATTIALCGCDTTPFLDENLRALHCAIPEATFNRVSNIFAPGKVFGDRYSASLAKFLDR